MAGGLRCLWNAFCPQIAVLIQHLRVWVHKHRFCALHREPSLASSERLMLHPHRSGIVMKNVKFSVSPRKNSPPVQKNRTRNDFNSQPSWRWAEVQCAHSMISPLRKSVSRSCCSIYLKAAFPFSNSQVFSSFLGFKSTHCTFASFKMGKLDGQSWQHHL